MTFSVSSFFGVFLIKKSVLKRKIQWYLQAFTQMGALSIAFLWFVQNNQKMGTFQQKNLAKDQLYSKNMFSKTLSIFLNCFEFLVILNKPIKYDEQLCKTQFCHIFKDIVAFFFLNMFIIILTMIQHPIFFLDVCKTLSNRKRAIE